MLNNNNIKFENITDYLVDLDTITIYYSIKDFSTSGYNLSISF